MNTSTPEPSPDAWMADGLCRQVDPEMFFPEKGGTLADAKRVCAACDVREQCLAYAVRNGERFGIWGGRGSQAIRAMTAKARRASETGKVWVDAP